MTVTWPDPTPSFYASLENARRRFNAAAERYCWPTTVVVGFDSGNEDAAAVIAFVSDGGDIEEIFSIERAFLGSVLDVEKCMTDYLTECASERSEDEEDA